MNSEMAHDQPRPLAAPGASATTPEVPGAAWLSGRQDWLLAAALLVAVLLAYLPAYHGGFLLDDDLHITKPELQSWTGLARIWFEIGATQQYYPVLHSFFWLEHRLWGDAVGGYHVANVLLHAAAALEIVIIARALRLRGGWLAAFLFALHPVCVESVAWIAEQKNTLSTVFALGSAIAYIHFDRSRRQGSYIRALGLFVLALLSKTVVVTLPAVLLVVLWWRQGRLRWRTDVLPLVPWFIVGLSVCLVTFAVEQHLLAGIGASFALNPIERVLVAGRAFWFYAREIILPVDLTFFYPRWQVDGAVAWQYIAPTAALALALWLLYRARSQRGPLAAFLCFAGTLTPVLGFINVEWFVFSYVADHLQYFSVVVAIIPLAATLTSLAERLAPAGHRAALAAGCLVACILGVLTYRQSIRYGDPADFYRAAIALNPSSAAAYSNLGAVYAAQPGRLPDAIAAYETALRMSPRSSDAEENLGIALLKDPTRRAEAVSHLEAAAQLRPNQRSLHVALALALAEMPERHADAVAEFEEALRMDPSDASLHNSLGLALLRDPVRAREAQAEFEEALRLKADFPEAHNNLGNILRRTPGRMQDAIAQYTAALRLKPDFAEAHNNIGLALAQTPGRMPEAVAHFQEALRLKPDFAGAHSNLGLAWIQTPGRINDAISEFQQAIRITPNFPAAWHLLGIAWMRAGNRPEAIAAFRNEVRLAPNNAAARQSLAEALQGSPVL